MVHAEGLAEQIGDVTLTCNGGTAGTVVTSIIYIGINATITNRLNASGNPANITVTINSGAGAVPYTSVTPTFSGPGTLFFNSVQYTVPNNPAQNVTIDFSGIRAAMPTATQSLNGSPAIAGSIAATNLTISNSLPLLALSGTSLLDSVLNYGIPCAGSPAPSTINFQNLISAGTSSSTIRLTEGFNYAFLPRSPSDQDPADTGVRILVQMSGYPTNAQVYVPNAIVGNRGTIPTTAGAFNTTTNGGTYTPNSGQLLLALVNGADATGNGGTLSFTAPTTVTSFSTMTQIPLTSGTGYATYEVLDSNPGQLDTAQVPVFVVAPATTCQTIPVIALGAMVAPVSTVAVPSQTAPIPRFVAATPGSDCTLIGDCSATYFPQLEVTQTSVTLSGSSLGAIQTGFITVGNGGTSEMEVNVTTTYQTASNLSSGNWLTVSPTFDIVAPAQGVNNNLILNLQANPAMLTIPGAYQATVVINAGNAGTVSVPVTFNVSTAGPVIQGVVNAANFQTGAVTANSFVAIFGQNLVAKKSLVVTFDGFPATVSYDGQPAGASSAQINALIPAGVGTNANVGLIVTVDGVVSNTFPVALTQNAPAVFNPGIENQDYSVNLAAAPASLNEIVQVFLTGLATPLTGTVTVTIGGLADLTPIYAGPVVSIPGLEQVNVRVPSDLQFANNSAPLSICVTGTEGQPLCSAPVNLYLQ